jgi:hypothetical protein
MAETIAEAVAQPIELPSLKDWRQFALLLDGYMIAKEMGLDYSAWAEKQEERYRQTGDWTLSVLELRLMLFYACRQERWTSLLGDWYYSKMADSLLRAISAQTGLAYQPVEIPPAGE